MFTETVLKHPLLEEWSFGTWDRALGQRESLKAFDIHDSSWDLK